MSVTSRPLSASIIGGLGRKRTPTLRRMIIQGASRISASGALTGEYTLEDDFEMALFAWGAGASGNSSNLVNFGGGGAAAGYVRQRVNRGTLLSWNLGVAGQPSNANPSDTGGAAGGDTVIALGSRTLTAQGGLAPTASTPAGRATASGFDVNRYGGGSGERGEFGADDGLYTGSGARGGGGGGFGDTFGAFTSGLGLSSSNTVPSHAAFGCGGRGQDHATYSAAGGEALLVALFYGILR